MTQEGFWANDPETGKDIYITYEELETDVRQRLIKPIGGFVFPATEFIACDKFVSVPFYIKDWLPQRGKLLIYAPAKSGKSLLAVQMARCIASQEDFLGMPTVQGRTLYLQFELGEAVLHQRLVSTGLNYPDVYVGTSFSIKLDNPIGQKQILKAMDAVQPRVVIFDPLYKAISGDENESSDMRAVCDFLDSLIEAYDCSVVVIHHPGKDLSKRARGSAVMEDWVDSFIRVTSKTEDKTLVMTLQPQLLRHAPIPEEPIKAKLLKDFEFHVPPRDELGRPLTVKEQIYDLASKKYDQFQPKHILVDESIGSNNSVFTALRELVAEKRLVKLEEGWYRAA